MRRPAWIWLLLAACGGPAADVHSPDPYERFLGALELEGRRDATAVADLVRMLEDPHYLVAAGAVTTLGMSGRPEFLQHVAPMTLHKHPLVRRDACEAIARLGNPAGLPFLLKALEDPDGLVRRGALKSLAAFRGLPEARQGLLKGLKDPEPGVAYTAHETLQAVTGRLDVPREGWAEILK